MQITATIFKNPLDEKKVKEMIKAGVDILRIKFAHVSNDEALEVVKKVSAIIDSEKAITKILADLPEFKVRLGGLDLGKEDVKKNKIYIMRPGKFSKTINDFIPVNVESFVGYFAKDDKVVLGDGEVWFRVIEVSSLEVKVEFPEGGFVDQYRSLMSHRLADDLDHCREALDSLEIFKEVKPDYLSLSFVDGADYIKSIRSKIEEIYGDFWQPKILAKIESPMGLKKIEEIVEVADEVVVARGDLGLTTDYTRVILEQKKICRVCHKKNKPVIVATQILTSCLHSKVPARCEIADLSNMILDGVSGIWFSQETSLHDNPGQVIHIARNIINTIETSYSIDSTDLPAGRQVKKKISPIVID